MKGSLIVIVFFCVGCIMGAFNKFEFDTHTVSMYILYAVMLQLSGWMLCFVLNWRKESRG